jgi:hypothetical protein
MRNKAENLFEKHETRLGTKLGRLASTAKKKSLKRHATRRRPRLYSVFFHSYASLFSFISLQEQELDVCGKENPLIKQEKEIPLRYAV